MYMTKNPFKKNMDGHLHRNVHDEKSYEYGYSFVQKCAWQKTIQKEMDSHLYINVHDENPFKKKWIVIRTEMCMTKTHTQRNGYSFVQKCAWWKPIHKEMDSHSYRNVHDENAYKKNIDSYSYRDVHDKNPYTKKWIVIRTNMCMTKTYSKRNG